PDYRDDRSAELPARCVPAGTRHGDEYGSEPDGGRDRECSPVEAGTHGTRGCGRIKPAERRVSRDRLTRTAHAADSDSRLVAVARRRLARGERRTTGNRDHLAQRESAG